MVLGETKEKVLTVDEILNKKSSTPSAQDCCKVEPKKKSTESSSSEDSDVEILKKCPKGRPKSGRVWKSEKKRCSSIIKTRGIRLSFEKKQALREELKRVKKLSRAQKEERARQKEEKRRRTEENKKRKEENRKKSEIVQVIKNTSKIKRMKKKLLRTIEKRDTTNM